LGFQVPNSLAKMVSLVTELTGKLRHSRCASNVAVVNIDNGFGTACFASMVNRL